MIELLKKGIFTGIGLASLTKEKIDQYSKELIKQGHVSEKEGKELVHHLTEISEREKKNMESKIEDAIERILKTIDIARKEDIRRLEKRIAKLEKAHSSKPDNIAIE